MVRNTNKRHTTRGLALVAALAAVGWAGNALPVSADAAPSRVYLDTSIDWSVLVFAIVPTTAGSPVVRWTVTSAGPR